MSSDQGTIVVRNAKRDDWHVIRNLLDGAGLPATDLGPERLENFLIAERTDADRNHVAGMIGLEQFGGTGLLRSLVVAETDRRSGLGRRLVAALEASALSAGITNLWLLTIDAERYFESLGYRLMSRDSAPESIRHTAEFSGLCPTSAHLMRKELRGQGN